VLVCAALLLGWLLLPVLGFGSDETLDPLRLALFPIPRRSLMAGLLGAALVGVPAVATAGALAGALVGWSRGVGTLLVLADVALLPLVCATGSRAVVTALAPLLRSRRGRDLAVLLTMLMGVLGYAAQLVLPHGQDDPEALRRRLDAAARVVRRTPFGWPGDALVAARDGRYATAGAELLGLALLGLGLLWLWAASLDRALTTSDAAAPEPERRDAALAPRLLRGLLPRGRAGAVAARDLRYLWRDPRRRAQQLGMLGFALVLPMVAFRDGGSVRPFALVYPALMIGLSGANQLGFDGAAWWLHVAAGVDGRADLLGKNLATLLVMLPALGLAAAGHVALGASPATTLAALGVAAGAAAISLGLADVVSVRAPYALPPSRSNPWATGANQGCATGLYAFLAFFATMLLLTPSIVLVAVGRHHRPLAVTGVLLALAVGGAVWAAGLAVAGRDLDRRAPEVLAKIDPRRA
jgi:ABC-2 type transport system permease protein